MTKIEKLRSCQHLRIRHSGLQTELASTRRSSRGRSWRL